MRSTKLRIHLWRKLRTFCWFILEICCLKTIIISYQCPLSMPVIISATISARQPNRNGHDDGDWRERSTAPSRHLFRLDGGPSSRLRGSREELRTRYAYDNAYQWARKTKTALESESSCFYFFSSFLTLSDFWPEIDRIHIQLITS